MNILEFQKHLLPHPAFSLKDIRKVKADFNRIQITRWEKKGYLKKIKRGLYCFKSETANQHLLWYIANKMHASSCISMETALKHYGLIPEEIFQTTSVTTKKTETSKTSMGSFRYNHIKPNLYWGYRLMDFNQTKIRVAEPEKAILDYLYLHPSLKKDDDFNGMRINQNEFKNQVDLEKFKTYLTAFKNKQLTKRAKIFLNVIRNDNT